MFLVDIEQSACRDFLVLREERFSSHSEFTKLLIVASIHSKLLEKCTFSSDKVSLFRVWSIRLWLHALKDVFEKSQVILVSLGYYVPAFLIIIFGVVIFFLSHS